MAYAKTHPSGWKDFPDTTTPVTAANLDQIEQGITDAAATADANATALAGKAPTTRLITAGTGLTGGGDLSADRALSVAYGTTGTTAAVGNDSRLSDARTPLAHTHPASDVTSGTLAVGRIGTGTPAAGKYVDGATGAWTALPAGGGGIAPRVPKVSSYMGPSGMYTTNPGGSALGSGSIPFARIEVGAAISIDQLGFRVTTAEAAMNAKVLLYSSDADGYPVTLVKDSGALSCAATGDILATFADVALTAGVYWACIRSNAGSTVRFMGGIQPPQPIIATTTSNAWNSANFLAADPGTYASPSATLTAWGDGTTIVSGNGAIPVVFIRRSV